MTEKLFGGSRICAVCGDNQKRILFQQKFSRLSSGSLMSSYNVVVCQNCGFAFADDIPDQKEFDIYYREMSKYEHLDRAGEPSEFEIRQFPALASLFQQHISTPQSHVLEIGCANGGLLNALKHDGYQNILGIDPSPVCAQNAEKLYQIRVLTSALSDVKPDEIGTFNFIILVAVLEHIKDLDKALNKINGLLDRDGKLYIEVPDVTQFTSSLDAPFQEFSIEHINFFSPISLANIMRAHGFEQVYASQTSYEQTDTHTGYALRMIFQKIHVDNTFTPLYDSESEAGIVKYVEASQKVENRIHRTVNDLVESQQSFIVWGVGTHTQRLLATSKLSSANISVFVDANPNYHGKTLNNIPVISPEQLIEKNDPILVSSRIFQSEIVQKIQSELKLKNQILTLYED